LENVVSILEVERLRLAAERARLQIEQAEHQLAVAALRADEAEANLRMHHITAPFEGVVTNRFMTRGQAVRQGDAVLKVIRTDAVKVEGEVTLAESARIKPGDKVTIQLLLPGGAPALGDRPFEGVLRGEAPDVDPISGKIVVWAEIPNPERILKVGLGAKMTIIPQKGSSVETTYLEQ
jgi:multidrug resistance efflux pump